MGTNTMAIPMGPDFSGVAEAARNTLNVGVDKARAVKQALEKRITEIGKNPKLLETIDEIRLLRKQAEKQIVETSGKIGQEIGRSAGIAKRSIEDQNHITAKNLAIVGAIGGATGFYNTELGQSLITKAENLPHYIKDTYYTAHPTTTDKVAEFFGADPVKDPTIKEGTHHLLNDMGNNISTWPAGMKGMFDSVTQTIQSGFKTICDPATYTKIGEYFSTHSSETMLKDFGNFMSDFASNHTTSIAVGATALKSMGFSIALSIALRQVMDSDSMTRKAWRKMFQGNQEAERAAIIERLNQIQSLAPRVA